ncbi:MAG: UvrD-helicase domain-containing protein [Chthoniobacteraceae bacterium]
MEPHASRLRGRGGGSMSVPADQSQRERFTGELECNFSVVASAGSGKTRAITDRIVTMARHDRALEWLPALVVVTYTNRAAAEMQQRARQSIIEADVRPEVLAAFNRAFFGTIHSLCMRLLRQHGHHLGLPGKIEHLDENNDAALWTEFLQQHTTLGGALDDTQRQTLLRLAPARLLMELGRKGPALEDAATPGPFPIFNFGAIYAFTADGRSLNAANRCRDALRRWEQAWAGGGFAGALPKCESKPLRAVWEKAVAPLRAWVQRAALHVAAATAQSFRAFRLNRGAMTYADQVTLAAELLRHPEAARRIRAKNHRVILDEAQDTDPMQFDLLIDVARPPDAAGKRTDANAAPPRAGHFCMVGDFQQSIYGSRADLTRYLRVHEFLLENGAGEALKFPVTFRLDEAGIGWVNTAFPALLHGADGQVHFAKLNPRPGFLPGQVARFDPGILPDMSDWKDWKKARWEADRLAHWLRGQGLENLRATSWSEVALLCPRTRWLPVLRAALRDAGLAAQVQSERAIKGDSAACAWFTALVVALAEPRNSYEIVGVLREVFGHSDQELADFSQRDDRRFQLAIPKNHGGAVADTLNLLSTLRAECGGRPLFSAMNEMVRVTRLRERLLTLPDADAGELDNLLTQAAVAETADATLEIFAEELRTGFSATREVRAVDRDAVQIISGHKAKGSEWDAVIVPFFARSVTLGGTYYPRTLRDPRTREILAALDSGDIDEELSEAIKRQGRQELERVLYVALTRARHTLVLVDDRALFRKKSGLPKYAQANLLRCSIDDTHAVTFNALPATLSPCEETREAQTGKSVQRTQGQIVPALAPCATDMLAAGRERAAFFIKRNPSALAEAALAEADPKRPRRPASTPSAGTRYGTWWHEFIEHIDWRSDSTAWNATFEKTLRDSPDAALSKKEWAMLRDQLTAETDLTRILRKPGILAHAEMPFLWAMNNRECLEGIIDLALFDPAEGTWLILDWKTNRTSDAELSELHGHYLPQLSAYWRAVSQMLAAPVSAGLYSTATALWLPYTADALAVSWHSLERQPATIASALAER